MVTPGRIGRDGQRFADGELVALANLRLSDITPDAIRQTYERCARKSTRRATYAMQGLRAVLRWHGVVIADNPLGKDTAGRDRIVLAPPKGDPSPIPPERLGAWWNAARKANSGRERLLPLSSCYRVAGEDVKITITPQETSGLSPPLARGDAQYLADDPSSRSRDAKHIQSDHRPCCRRQALKNAAYIAGKAPEVARCLPITGCAS